MIGRPEGMTWEVTATDKEALAGSATTKTLAIYFVGKKDGPQMEFHIILPADARKPAPLFLVPSVFNPNPEKLLGLGDGFPYFNPASVKPPHTNLLPSLSPPLFPLLDHSN